MGIRKDQLDSFYAGMKALKSTQPDQIEGFHSLLKASTKNGALDYQTKELISVAIACYSRCEYCIAYHVHCALKAGIESEKILEAGMVAVLFGGGPAMAYISTVLNDCVKEFIDMDNVLR